MLLKQKATDKSFLFELREAKRKCSNVDHKALLGQVADSLAFALRRLNDCPSTETMIEVNGAWAHAKAALDATPPEGEPAPISGAPEATRFAMVA